MYEDDIPAFTLIATHCLFQIYSVYLLHIERFEWNSCNVNAMDYKALEPEHARNELQKLAGQLGLQQIDLPKVPSLTKLSPWS